MKASDPNVEAAIAHWAPRFIANGVDYNDFQATTARIGRWADWSTEWSRTAGRHEKLAREAEARGSAVSAAEAYVRAAICHHFGKFVFFEDMAQYRRVHAATVSDYRKAAPRLEPKAEPVAVPYDGMAMPGYLRRPAGASPPPVVIIICGLDSVKEEMNSLESVFHRRGMATLAFDGPGQGESEARSIEPAFDKVVSAVIDWLERRADIDAARVSAVGVSLGGYYAARAAAYEQRLTCAASVGGPYDFGVIFDDLPELTRQAFQVRSHAPDPETAKERAGALTLEGAARNIEIPFLTVFGRQDRLIPYAQAETLHAEIPAPEKRLALYPDGNHVCNNIPFVWRPLVADWMAGHFKVGDSGRS